MPQVVEGVINAEDPTQEFTSRSPMLPPPIPGEESLDLRLVHLVRNGSMAIEDEAAY